MLPSATSLFRWNTYVVDGHSVEDLCKAFWEASQVQGKPTCILAKTYKGQGIPGKRFWSAAFLFYNYYGFITPLIIKHAWLSFLIFFPTLLAPDSGVLFY